MLKLLLALFFTPQHLIDIAPSLGQLAEAFGNFAMIIKERMDSEVSVYTLRILWPGVIAIIRSVSIACTSLSALSSRRTK